MAPLVERMLEMNKRKHDVAAAFSVAACVRTADPAERCHPHEARHFFRREAF
jgi:hypothetical protein